MTWALLLVGSFVLLGSSPRQGRLEPQVKAVLLIVAVVAYEAVKLRLL